MLSLFKRKKKKENKSDISDQLSASAFCKDVVNVILQYLIPRDKEENFKNWARARRINKQWKEMADERARNILVSSFQSTLRRFSKEKNEKRILFLVRNKMIVITNGFPVQVAISVISTSGSTRCLKEYLEGIELTELNKGSVAAEWICTDGNAEMLDVVIKRGMDLIVQNCFQFSANSGSLDCLKALIDRYEDSLTPQIGYTVLWTAKNSSKPEIIQYVIDNCLDIFFSKEGPDNQLLHYVDNHHTLRMLLKQSRINLNTEENISLIQEKIRYNHIEWIKAILESGQFDPSCRDNQAVINAAGSGRVDVLTMLLKDKRVNPGARENQALKDAIALSVVSWMETVDENRCTVEMLLKDQRVNACDAKEQIEALSNAVNASPSKNKLSFVMMLKNSANMKQTNLPKH